VSLLHNRLDLFTTELEEERERIQQILVLGAATFLCLSFGVLLVTFFVVVVFWDTSLRLVVLGGLALFYLITGGIMGAIARRRSRHKPKAFSATMGELAKDYRNLSS
jgi:uncharacterized membrane protein YqjE